MPSAALVSVRTIAGIFAGGRIEWVGLGVVALFAAGVPQALAARRM